MVSPGLEKDLLSIWERTKKDIDTSQLTLGSPEEMAHQLKSLLETIPKNKIAVKNLINSGFPDAAVKNETIIREFQKPTKPKEATPIKKIEKIKATDGKVSIKTKKGTKTYSKKNIKIAYGKYKDKPAFFVYNTKTKKRTTWGLLE